jgi:serine/threonine protein kinase/Tfp pilus assembly protein PilF
LIAQKDTPSVTKTLETPFQELTRGTVFADRYEIIEELGKGGMGKVFRVEDKKIDQEVALKLIKHEIASDKKTIERFRNELKTARMISHRNVSRMFDLGEIHGTHYITMEYVPGQNLKSLIRQTGRLDISTAISIAKQICEGLSEAHRLGIIHRDLKPSNIMIDREGSARIMDFGIARSVERTGTTEAGAMIGTPEYMSPEQVEGKEIDHRSDIYSLGIVLYEILTGKVPFEGDTAIAIAVKQKTEEPADPRELNPQLGEDLSNMILKCLEKDKEKRFRDVRELFSELNAIDRDTSTTGKTITETKTLVSRDIKAALGKHRRLLLVIFMIVILAGMAILYYQSRDSVTTPEEIMLAVLPFNNLGLPEDEYFAEGITEEITNRLAAISDLGVISRTSAIQYKNTKKTLREIGRELGVDYVLEGAVRWNRSTEGRGRVRINPQLIRVTDDKHLWVGSYDRIIEDIFSVQSEIAEEVARQLDLTILEPERKALNAKPTDNLESYDNYLRANELYNQGYLKRDLKLFEQSIDLFEKSIELDPDFTLAYTTLSIAHSLIFTLGIDRSEDRLRKSRDAVEKALELEPNSPEALHALAAYYYRGFSDYDRVLKISENIQKARPNMMRPFHGSILRNQGKWAEAIAVYEGNFRLNPRSSQTAHVLGRVYARLRKYAESKKWFDRALSIEPGLYYSKLGLVRLAYLSKGNTQAARALLETMPKHVLTDYAWFELCMLERNFDELRNRLDSSAYRALDEVDFYLPMDLVSASMYHAQKDLSQRKKHANQARLHLEIVIEDNPNDARMHAALGLAYAYTGRKEEAARAGKKAVNLNPISKDAYTGPRYVLDLAAIYTVIDEYEEAISQLEFLMSIPAGNILSASLLKLDPRWDSLRNHPRFISLLKESGRE